MMINPRNDSMTLRSTLIAVCASAALACGGSDGGPTTGPSPSPNPGPPVATTTITITASGVNPQRIQVPAGSRVTFINNDSRPHEMNSDPHPTHGDCPAIDDVGFIAVGQTKLTGNLTTVRTCAFHDHQQPTVTALTGQIIVQ
jgi:plastocyanin